MKVIPWPCVVGVNQVGDLDGPSGSGLVHMVKPRSSAGWVFYAVSHVQIFL